MSFTIGGLPLYQSYPPPTVLPALRAGETEGRYMDCGPALLPIEDFFTNITTVSVAIARVNGAVLGPNDLQLAVGFAPDLDPTGTIATFTWYAPPTNTGAEYLLTLTATPTSNGATFVRDWRMSVIPLMG